MATGWNSLATWLTTGDPIACSCPRGSVSRANHQDIPSDWSEHLPARANQFPVQVKVLNGFGHRLPPRNRPRRWGSSFCVDCVPCPRALLAVHAFAGCPPRFAGARPRSALSRVGRTTTLLDTAGGPESRLALLRIEVRRRLPRLGELVSRLPPAVDGGMWPTTRLLESMVGHPSRHTDRRSVHTGGSGRAAVTQNHVLSALDDQHDM
jgi:hypothetical protein